MVELTDTTKFCVVSVYKQPLASPTCNKNFYAQLRDFLFELGEKYENLGFIIGGDFNARTCNENAW